MVPDTEAYLVILHMLKHLNGHHTIPLLGGLELDDVLSDHLQAGVLCVTAGLQQQGGARYCGTATAISGGSRCVLWLPAASVSSPPENP